MYTAYSICDMKGQHKLHSVFKTSLAILKLESEIFNNVNKPLTTMSAAIGYAQKEKRNLLLWKIK